MPYIILKSDGSTLTTVPDGQYDNVTTSLNLIGKNLFNYGQYQNENFVHLLENFASTASPNNPLIGQLWFDKSLNTLKVFHGANWKNISIISTSSSIANELGNLWFNLSSGQLSINNGSGFTLIGPDSATGFGTTRFLSTTILDDSLVEHPIIQGLVDNEVILIISNEEFDIDVSTPVLGFSRLYRGVNLKNASANDAILFGSSSFASNADNLRNAGGTGYTFASTATSANTIVQRDGNGFIRAAGANISAINANTGTFTGIWSLNNNFVPDRDNGVNLGAEFLRWANIYSRNTDSDIVRASQVTFNSIIDSSLNSINSFDRDTSLAANADNRIPTQRAVKTYVDNAVAAGGGGGGGGPGYTGSIGYTGSAGTGTGGPATPAPPLLYNVTSGYTSGGRVVIKSTTPTAGDVPGGSLLPGDIWLDPSADTGYTQLALENGWTKLPNGVLIQWGRASPGFNLSEGYFGPFNFNTNFTGNPWTVVATPYLINPNNGADVWLQVVTSSLSPSQFWIQYQRKTVPSYGIDGFTWMAIGPG
jgi:hypothetical protein